MEMELEFSLLLLRLLRRLLLVAVTGRRWARRIPQSNGGLIDKKRFESSPEMYGSVRCFFVDHGPLLHLRDGPHTFTATGGI